MSYTSPTIEAIERAHLRTDLPEFRAGDTVKVHALISEGGKDRVQIFEGVCIHRKRGGARGSFTIRKMSHGVGVERVWPEASPLVVKVELVNRGKVRRGKLYYLRGLRGNAARIKTKLGAYASTLALDSTPAEEIVPELATPEGLGTPEASHQGQAAKEGLGTPEASQQGQAAKEGTSE